MHAFAHYLESKRSVDDRALNRRVLDRLREKLSGLDRPAIADIGAGIGAGIERLVDWGVVSEPRYTAVEKSTELVDIARARLRGRIDSDLVCSTLASFAAEPSNHGRFDLVIAHAFLDIVDMDPAVQSLVTLARPEGLLYLPITYDGESAFEPEHEDDEAVLSRYHRAMDRNGSSKTGRKLFRVLERAPVEILEVGSSDWIVTPKDGGYPGNEKYFLECILEMVAETVGETAKDWAEARRRQVANGQLVYVAHQLDYLATKSS